MRIEIPERTKKFLEHQEVGTLMYQVKLGKKKIILGNATDYEKGLVDFILEVVRKRLNKFREEICGDDLGDFLFEAYINALQM